MGVQKPKNKVTLFVEERSVHQQQKRLPSDDTFVYIIHDNPFFAYGYGPFLTNGFAIAYLFVSSTEKLLSFGLLSFSTYLVNSSIQLPCLVFISMSNGISFLWVSEIWFFATFLKVIKNWQVRIEILLRLVSALCKPELVAITILCNTNQAHWID